MRVAFLATVTIFAAAGFLGCDRSDTSILATASPDGSQYGVITAPQVGTLPDQPQIDGQMNVTRAQTATADEGSTRPALGNRPSAVTTGTEAGASETTAGAANGAVQPAETPAPGA